MGRPVTREDSLLEALLDAVPVPAFVLRGDGSVERSNALGQRALHGRRVQTLRDLAASATGPSQTYEVREVRTPDGAPVLLVLARRSGPSVVVAGRAAAWQLSKREADVLAHVATGLGNKQIAGALRIAEVTVENHLTRIFRKASVDSRAALLACLLREAEGSP